MILDGLREIHRRGSRRLVVIAAGLTATAWLGAIPASAATWTVCPSGCAYTQIGPAIAAASSGDTVSIGPGTYLGGFMIDKNLTLDGAGARRTIVKGGGPVITIGSYGATIEPTVGISGMTITGGVTDTSPESIPTTGEAGVIAAGGGIEIPPNADFTGGAVVTIANSVIAGNRVAPTATDDGVPCPGLFDGYCPFAAAYGGGIDSWGSLTVINTTVSGNLAGSASGLSTLASDANGGGIYSERGDLTVTNTVIKDNAATASGPNGRFADSGGIFAEGSTFALTDSAVTSNIARLDASLPDSVSGGFAAIGGGIHIAGTIASATVSNSIVADNSVTMTNSVGSAQADSGGIHEDVNVPLNNDIIAGNSVRAQTLPGSSGNASGDSGAGELFGPITNSGLIGNTVTAAAVAGNATAGGGASLTAGTLSNDTIAGNAISASSTIGPPTAGGGGLVVGSLNEASEELILQNTTVAANTASVNGSPALGLGGGILDNPVAPAAPGGALELVNSRVVGNSLLGTTSATLLGGGIFAPGESVTLTRSQVAGNRPGQCYGC
jgi:hypothetical protein